MVAWRSLSRCISNVNNAGGMQTSQEVKLTGQSVTVGWQERTVRVVVALKVSVTVSQAPASKARAPRATMMAEARIVDDDDYALKVGF